MALESMGIAIYALVQPVALRLCHVPEVLGALLQYWSCIYRLRLPELLQVV
jgi:hypothetical protein